MTLETTSAYITKVRPDHTVVLPADMPVGATVAVVVVPSDATEVDEAARHDRFAKTLDAIRAASAQETTLPSVSDGELDALIETARKTPRA